MYTNKYNVFEVLIEYFFDIIRMAETIECEGGTGGSTHVRFSVSTTERLQTGEYPHAFGNGLWSRTPEKTSLLLYHIDASIFKLWDEYDDHKIVCEDFLRQMGEI